MSERWETADEIGAARRRFEAAIPGWAAPAAYGVGLALEAGVDFRRVNVGEHPLPAVVLATVCGRTAESAAYRLDADALDRAIELLAPAEACALYDHPNLAAWRALRAEMGPDGTAVAVFVADLNEFCADEAVAALRQYAIRTASSRS